MRHPKTRRALENTARELFRRDIVEDFLGTISARTPDGTYLVKPQNVDYLRLTREKFIEITLQGEPIRKNRITASPGWLSLNWWAH